VEKEGAEGLLKGPSALEFLTIASCLGVDLQGCEGGKSLSLIEGKGDARDIDSSRFDSYLRLSVCSLFFKKKRKERRGDDEFEEECVVSEWPSNLAVCFLQERQAHTWRSRQRTFEVRF
jgi:hypothetical protein